MTDPVKLFERGQHLVLAGLRGSALFALLLDDFFRRVGDEPCVGELAIDTRDVGVGLADFPLQPRAFGRDASFLYAWARAVVINTGAIAILQFSKEADPKMGKGDNILVR